MLVRASQLFEDSKIAEIHELKQKHAKDMLRVTGLHQKRLRRCKVSTMRYYARILAPRLQEHQKVVCKLNSALVRWKIPVSVESDEESQ